MSSIPKKPIPLLLLRAFSVLVGAAALSCGAQALRRHMPLFDGPPQTPLSPQFRTQLHTVMQRLPPGEFVLYLSASPEYWYSRLCQRTLYPRNETILIQPPLDQERVRAMRTKYRARFVIFVGGPSFDPGYLWRVDVGQFPGVPGEVWFGELRP